MSAVSFSEFEKVHICSGTILRAEDFPRAKKPAFKIWADFGETYGVLQSSAQITVHYRLEDLPGKQILGCVNLGEKKHRGIPFTVSPVGICR
jgi:tRNA-binding protein